MKKGNKAKFQKVTHGITSPRNAEPDQKDMDDFKALMAFQDSFVVPIFPVEVKNEDELKEIEEKEKKPKTPPKPKEEVAKVPNDVA